MKITTLNEFGELVYTEGMNVAIMMEAFEVLGISHNVTFININNLEQLCKEHCFKEGFDPDTTAVVVHYPEKNPTGEPVSDKHAEDSAYTQCICCFYPGHTPEELAAKILKVFKLKAFI